jgi:hypothetical protein
MGVSAAVRATRQRRAACRRRAVGVQRGGTRRGRPRGVWCCCADADADADRGQRAVVVERYKR